MSVRRLSCLAIALCFAGPAAAGDTVEKVDFERHVMGLFSKAGCNNGSCHGSFQGKNGFRLSLFGFDPDKDHAALTREIQGRRINTINPDDSLLLRKATGTIPHEGGARFGKDSWQYRVFREWIRAGAPRAKGSGEIVDIAINPKEYVFVTPGKPTRLTVTAKFADGSSEDITPYCDFKVQDDGVARVSPVGEVTAGRPGDSGLAVLYRGKVTAARLLVPADATGQLNYSNPANYLDREVFAKLQLLKVLPSEPASDLEFLRRVTIDVTGALPTPDEVRSFVADQSPDKRAKKVDELLKSPRHAALWATKLSDVTGNNTLALEQPQDMQIKRSQMWHDWLRARFEQNVPYDRLVKGILTATSREGKTPDEWIEQVKKVDEQADNFDTTEYAKRDTLDLFWRRQGQVPPIEWGEKVAAAFLGVRLECAQCHKHPTDRWTQADYRAFANLFTNISAQQNQFSSPDMKKVVDAEIARRLDGKPMPKNNNQRTQIREMFLRPVAATAPGRRPGGGGNLLTHPDTNQPLAPKAPAGPEFQFESGKDVRADLFVWMRSPDNPFFARSFVNRIWAHYFGVGLVDPVDDFSQANPPTNARLLDALAKDFIEHDYDIRHIERTILNSRTYQTSAVPNETNRFDKVNFARSYVRPMMAEVVVDVVNDALGTTEAYGLGGGKGMDGRRMTEVGSSRMNNPNLAYALRIFGRPPRTTACDCERAMEPALPQTLFRMTDPDLLRKMTGPQNRVAKLLKEKGWSDEQVLDELFLATLTRHPRPDEVATFQEHRKTTSDRTAAFTDVVWALLNTREFILNH